MTYRTLLVHADMSDQAPARIRAAATLANAFEAHLVGAALTGVSRFLQLSSIEMPGDMITSQINLMHDAARAALARFDDLACSAGVRSYEGRLVNDDIDGGMVVQARYADLAIVSQPDPDQAGAGPFNDLPEYLLLNTGRPVLVLPSTGWTGRDSPLGAKVLVAWDGSIEATRAVTAAVPLLKLARQVVLAVFNAEQRPGTHGELPGADLGLYLSRHGVNVEVQAQTSTIDVGNALLSCAADLGADLLVMGGYGHTRFRELMLGGATRTILRTQTLPVLLAH